MPYEFVELSEGISLKAKLWAVVALLCVIGVVSSILLYRAKCHERDVMAYTERLNSICLAFNETNQSINRELADQLAKTPTQRQYEVKLTSMAKRLEGAHSAERDLQKLEVPKELLPVHEAAIQFFDGQSQGIRQVMETYRIQDSSMASYAFDGLFSRTEADLGHLHMEISRLDPRLRQSMHIVLKTLRDDVSKSLR